MLFLSLFIIIFLPSTTSVALAASSGVSSVIINEIAWMGTTISANDEWLELFNDTISPITLDGWILKSADEKLKINLKGLIPSKGFYLLERTDDTTVPDITADLIYKGALNNTGEDLKLYDSLNNLIDGVACPAKWIAGDNATKQTMEAFQQAQSDNREWQTSENPGGTPKAQNSSGIIIANNPTPTVKSDPIENGSTTEISEGIPLTTSATSTALTASVSQESFGEIKKSDSQFLKVFGLAVLIAALSGIAILMLKRLIRP